MNTQSIRTFCANGLDRTISVLPTVECIGQAAKIVAATIVIVALPLPTLIVATVIHHHRKRSGATTQAA